MIALIQYSVISNMYLSTLFTGQLNSFLKSIGNMFFFSQLKLNSDEPVTDIARLNRPRTRKKLLRLFGLGKDQKYITRMIYLTIYFFRFSRYLAE